MPRGGFRENAGRKSGWNNTETQVIRVPKSLAPQLIEIARKLNNGEAFELVTESKTEAESIERIVLAPATEPAVIPNQMNLLDFDDEISSSKIAVLQNEEFSLPISDLGRRWSQTTPSITRAKREKSRQDFIDYSKKKEEALGNNFGWEYLLNINRFQPVDISPEKLQELKEFYHWQI